jgi:hypothetical protein
MLGLHDQELSFGHKEINLQFFMLCPLVRDQELSFIHKEINVQFLCCVLKCEHTTRSYHLDTKRPICSFYAVSSSA